MIVNAYESNPNNPKCVMFIEIFAPKVIVNEQVVQCQTEWNNPNRIDAAWRAGTMGCKMVFVYKDPVRGERYGFYVPEKVDDVFWPEEINKE